MRSVGKPTLSISAGSSEVPRRMNDLVEQIRAMAQKATDAIGVELIRVEYKRAGRGFVVRVTINREGGTGIRDCEQISRMMGHDLDAVDLIPGRYSLEVMSRGIS